MRPPAHKTNTAGRHLLSDLPPGRRHIQFALWFAAILVVALCLTIPFARVSLPRSEPFLPAYAAAIIVNDLLTTTLLLALFSARRSPAVLALAWGYLFVGLLAIPWALTFPGVFAEQGLLGAGQQTTAVIAALRRIGFPLFVLAYGVLNVPSVQPQSPPSGRAWPPIAAGLIATAALATGATAFVILHDESMPRLMASRMEESWLWTAVAAISNALYLVAIAAIWARRRSVLDVWLLVVLLALAIEIVLLSFISSGRLSVGWWAGRAYGLAAASVILGVMLWETTTLYARFARSVEAERRAKEIRVTSLEALSAAIAHEVNQPLASMVTNADAGLLWLDRPDPELGEVKAAFGRIVEEGHRAGKVVESIRTLFRKDARDRTLLDLNEVVAEVLPELRRYARLNKATIEFEAGTGLAPVSGNALQLQEVVSNLAANAVEAMVGIEDRARILRIKTENSGSSEVVLSVADTGGGLMEQNADKLFEPFVTTKPSGLGMGLMICRSIVEAHGGRIRAERGVTHGSVLRVALPTAETTASSTRSVA